MEMITQFLLLCSLSVLVTAQGRNCGSAGEVDNGVVEYPQGTHFNAVLQVICNPGYIRFGGTAVMKCGTQGVWLGKLPDCKAITCVKVPQVENANVSPVKQSYRFRESIKYTCFSGYMLVGWPSLTCSDDRTFEPDAPECSRIQCAEPVVENGRRDGGAQPPYRYLSTVTYTCNNGYQMEGEGTLVCEKDNNWSPRPPTCKFVGVPVPPPPPPVSGGNNVGKAVGIAAAVLIGLMQLLLQHWLL